MSLLKRTESKAIPILMQSNPLSPESVFLPLDIKIPEIPEGVNDFGFEWRSDRFEPHLCTPETVIYLEAKQKQRLQKQQKRFETPETIAEAAQQGEEFIAVDSGYVTPPFTWAVPHDDREARRPTLLKLWDHEFLNLSNVARKLFPEENSEE